MTFVSPTFIFSLLLQATISTDAFLPRLLPAFSGSQSVPTHQGWSQQAKVDFTRTSSALGMVSTSSPSSTAKSSYYGDKNNNNSPKRTLYDILRLPPTATRTELKYAYVTLAKKTHPDALGMMGRTATAADIERFHEIASAWQILSDREAKRRYDLNMRVDAIDSFTASREKWAKETDCRWGCGIDDDFTSLKYM